MVFLGLEAEEIDALQEVHKQLNVQRGIQGYKQAFRRIHKAGIAVLGAFIFGMDGDTRAKLQRRANYMIYNRGIDIMQRTRLTPLPGTRLFDRYRQEGRLLYTNFPQDWDHYDMTEVVHRPGSLDPDQLSQTIEKLDRRMYSLPVLFCKALMTYWQTRDKITRDKIATMFAWNSNLNYRNVGRGIAR